VTAALQARGIDAVLIDSVAASSPTPTIPSIPLFDESSERLRHHLKPLLQAGQLPVMGGFIGATAEGVPTTLGRGGSDFPRHHRRSAECTQNRDLDRCRRNDDHRPPLVPTSATYRCHRIRRGVGVGLLRCEGTAPGNADTGGGKEYSVHVLNSRRPESRGTCIRARAPRSRTVFRAIAAKSGMRVVNIKSPRMLMAHGFLRAVFEAFDRHACAADLVSTSEVSVSVALDSSRDANALVQDLKKLGEVDVENGKAVICLVVSTFAASRYSRERLQHGRSRQRQRAHDFPGSVGDQHQLRGGRAGRPTRGATTSSAIL